MAEESTYERKRREIIATALDLFSTRGFEGTTLEAVAEVLGYTKPALYYYFKSKEDLFRSLILDSLKEAETRLRNIVARRAPVGDRLCDVIHLLLDDHLSRRGYFSISHVLPGFKERMLGGPEREEIERLSGKIPSIIMELIAEGVDSGDFMDEDPKIIGGIVFGMISGVLMHISIPALSSIDHDRLKSRLDRIVIKGISA